MSEAKHTPGPWKARFEEAYYVTGPDLGRVAMMMNLKGAYGLGGRRTGEESAANCRLIAAAPALYEALARLLPEIAPPPSVWDDEETGDDNSLFRAAIERARAAVALARGEA